MDGARLKEDAEMPAKVSARLGSEAFLRGELLTLSRSMASTRSLCDVIDCARHLLAMRCTVADVLFRLRTEGSLAGFGMVRMHASHNALQAFG